MHPTGASIRYRLSAKIQFGSAMGLFSNKKKIYLVTVTVGVIGDVDSDSHSQNRR
jgi:hypothetical protein